ncbi:MAG: ribosome maturation factor RimP [Pseudomonadota bacterium]
MQPISSELLAIVEPVVDGLGFECVGALLGQAESGLTLRVYIDHNDGVDVDDCGAVSQQLSAALDVDDPIGGHYVLEVSSPGIDRPLFQLHHYAQYVGQRVKVRMAVPLDGRRRFTGELVGVTGDNIDIEVDGERYTLSFGNIEMANLSPVFQGSKR